MEHTIIDAKNEQNKQETIARLYALRGGLSVMAQLHDTADATLNRIKSIQFPNADKIIQENQRKRRNYMEQIKELEQAIESTTGSIKYYQRAVEEETAEYHKKKKWYTNPRKGVICSWLSIFCLILLFFVGSRGLSEGSNLEALLVILSFVGFVVLGIAGGILKIKDNTEWYGWAYMGIVEKIPDDLDEFVKNAKRNLRENESLLLEHQRKLATLKNNQDAYFAMIEKEKQTALDENQATINQLQLEIAEGQDELTKQVQHFHAAYRAVQEEFSAFLDERDWANVDLIIFNYETGRALDMRDALLQVDNERRNERLLKAVQDASKSISASINRGFGSLQLTLHSHFDRLDRKIADFSGQIASIADASTRQTQILGQKLESIEQSTWAQTQALKEASSAQQALLAKATTSSSELAASVEKIRLMETDRYYGIH